MTFSIEVEPLVTTLPVRAALPPAGEPAGDWEGLWVAAGAPQPASRPTQRASERISADTFFILVSLQSIDLSFTWVL